MPGRGRRIRRLTAELAEIMEELRDIIEQIRAAPPEPGDAEPVPEQGREEEEGTLIDG